MNKGLFSSKTDEWETPQDFFDRLDDEFHFGLDPCATLENAKCKKFFTKENSGLSQGWGGYGAVFVNPPYGREIGLWVQRAYDQSRVGAVVVMLIPVRTDTRWWHDYVMQAQEIRLVRGRLRFGDGKGSAPFPSAVVVFDPPWPKQHTEFPEPKKPIVVKSMQARTSD